MTPMSSLMMGARDRLLPPSIPYRFFITAAALHVAGWAALAAAGGELADFRGGLGLPLAGLHLITLGVLAMTAMGAAFQMLPMATRRRLGPHWACRAAWWVFTPGVVALSLGMATGAPWALHGGTAATLAGLLLFAALVADNLRGVGDLPMVTRHLWPAVAGLVAAAILGAALATDFAAGFLPDHGGIAAAHAVLGGYGFMGMLALGFSQILIPMFVLAPSADEVQGRRSPWLAVPAVALGIVGAAAGSAWLATLGAVLGLAALSVHLWGMRATLRRRMRKRLEPCFRLIFAAWILAPLSLLAALAALWGAVAPALWGWLMVFGWLLTFTLGVLQRIMPFLASMHSGGEGIAPALPSRLTAERPLALHALCHAAALILTGAGMAARLPILTQAGTLSGLTGALAFAMFTAELGRRYRRHHKASGPIKGGR